MKNFILTLTLLLTGQLFAQRDSVFIKTRGYSCVYSEVLQQPKCVWYTVQCPTGEYPRKGMDFYTVDSVITSDSRDYEKNVWDKGHCAPAADFNCTRETLWRTFSYLNCVLQHEKLNRGAWRLLEVRERELAKHETVEVEIRMIYTAKSIKLPTGAVVPVGFYKTIKFGNKKEVYYFANEAPSTTDFRKYQVQ
jgi:endonuclease G